MHMHFEEWLAQVEEIISSRISYCNPREWNEDHISYSWLGELTRNLPSVDIVGSPSGFKVAWDAFKADGPLEEANGDVAVLVKISFPNGSSCEGVGFLEAKRRYMGSGYDAIKWDQLEYQSSNVANHRLLLYDYEIIEPSAENLQTKGYCRACYPAPFTSVFAAVLPTPHALALHTRSANLSHVGTPLSYQICCRYLQGYDLDYSEALVRAVKQGIPKGVKYLFVAHVLLTGEGGEGGEPTPQVFEIDKEHFRRVRREEAA